MVQRSSTIVATSEALLEYAWGRLYSEAALERGISLLAQGETAEAILKDYPGLTRDDIQACLAYAHAVIANDSLDAVRVGG